MPIVLSATPCGFAWLLVMTAATQLYAQADKLVGDSKLQSRPLYQDTQQALKSLARVEIDREEASFGRRNFEPVLGQLRATISQLRTIESQLTVRLRRSYQQPLSAQVKNSWSIRELESLRRNLKLQLARAYRNQGLCYVEDSADRVNALSLALEQVSDIVTLPHDEPSVWQGRLEQIVCLRLLKKAGEAQQQIGRWQSASPPVEIAARLTGETLLSDLEQGDVQQALAKALTLLDNQEFLAACVPETDDAILTVLLAARAQTTPNQATQLTQRAIRQLQRIASEHGPTWKRRAEVRIGQAFTKRDSEQTHTDDPELLSHAAAQLYATGKLREAVAAYDRIAMLFAAQTAENQRFQALKTAAAIVGEMKQHEAALRRFQRLALEHPQYAEAASTHFIAIGLAAQLARDAEPAQRGEQFERYLKLLGEHLQQWPQQPSAEIVELWVARAQHPDVEFQRAQTLSALGDRQQALALYGRLANASPHDAELLEAYARLLAKGANKSELREALRLWQMIEKRSTPGGPRWSRGRRARLELLEQLGEGGQAERLRQLTEILYPNSRE